MFIKRDIHEKFVNFLTIGIAMIDKGATSHYNLLVSIGGLI